MQVKAEERYQYLTQQICNLVGADSASLFLGCPDPLLRHSILDLLYTPGYHPLASTGSPGIINLLQHERIQALCDLAVQTGELQTIDRWQPCIYPSTYPCTYDNHSLAQSIAIVPLERPAGVLGFFLLTAPRTHAFYHGERLLLHHYLPRVAQQLENDLRGLCSTHPLKFEFISMVSHELRVPLTAIKGYAVLLQAYGHHSSEDGAVEEMTPLRQREYLDIIMKQTDHLEVLISDLLDISRLHAGRLHLRCSHINVSQLCQRVIQLIQQRAGQQQLGSFEITCVVAPDIPFVWADAGRVQQILTNFLENAIKYSPGGGLIEVVASLFPPIVSPSHGEILPQPAAMRDSAILPEPAMVHITVRDQGIGISPEQQTHLFRPFSRLEHPLAVDVPGAGLGLYITRKLVEAMGGNITLSSSEGAGTSITFTLPIKAP